jgi:hypothetical protein
MGGLFKFRFIINGGAAGGKQFLGALDQAQTNSTLREDTLNIINALSAAIDGALYGTYNENLYPTSLDQNSAAGTAFVTDFLFVGDIRNLGLSSYNAAVNDGSLGDVALSVVGFLPIYDIAKGAYKIADNVFDFRGLSNVANALDGVTDASAAYLGNLSRHADISGASSFSLEGSINSIVTSASRNDMNFTSVVVQDADAFVSSLGMSVSSLTTTAAKGEFGERAAQSWARSNGLECYFCSADTSAQGIDNIFRNPSTGEFIVSESKWISSNSNVGIGSLSSTNSGKQLSSNWMFGNSPNANSALNRTPGLTGAQRTEIYNASLSGNVSTQLVVVKPTHVGAGITQKLTDNSTFGTNGSEKLGDIVIIEVLINP